MFIWQSDHMRICFFYSFRFRVCPCSNDDENEQFCFNIGDDYPSSLLVATEVPPPITINSTIGYNYSSTVLGGTKVSPQITTNTTIDHNSYSTFPVGSNISPQLTTNGTTGHAATASYSILLLLFTAAMCCLF